MQTRMYIEDDKLVSIKIEEPKDIIAFKTAQVFVLAWQIRKAFKAKGVMKALQIFSTSIYALAVGSHAYVVQKKFRDEAR
jgi:hypothetical protein